MGMQRIELDGEEIEFSDEGAGEPVLLVHAGVFSDWFKPVAASIELQGNRVIRMRRAGYVSGRMSGAHLALGDHARHCGDLLDYLGIESAHYCGHSSSALIGLELALQRPAIVRTLVLLEPAPCGDLSGPGVQAVAPAFGAALAAHAAGDDKSAFNTFMQIVGGDRWGSVVDAALGSDGHARAINESAFFFEDEMPACLEWQFGSDEGARVRCPVLIVVGEATKQAADLHDEAASLLAGILTDSDSAVLPATNHLLPLQDPDGVARLIAGFAKANPIVQNSSAASTA
jgi:pimeloyl-ACP methyl ester carboxylesterase